MTVLLQMQGNQITSTYIGYHQAYGVQIQARGWREANGVGLTRNRSVVSSNSITDFRCFLEKEHLPSILSTGGFQERIRGSVIDVNKIVYFTTELNEISIN